MGGANHSTTEPECASSEGDITLPEPGGSTDSVSRLHHIKGAGEASAPTRANDPYAQRQRTNRPNPAGQYVPPDSRRPMGTRRGTVACQHTHSTPKDHRARALKSPLTETR